MSYFHLLKHSILPVSFLLVAGTCHAQDDSSALISASSLRLSNIEPTLEVRIDSNLSVYLMMMDSLDAHQLKTQGYRIQIFASSGPTAKKEALKSQSDFLQIYSEHSAYTAWDYPNWVVRLGDYRNHLDAQAFHDEIKQIYPASFIVKDEIKVD